MSITGLERSGEVLPTTRVKVGETERLKCFEKTTTCTDDLLYCSKLFVDEHDRMQVSTPSLKGARGGDGNQNIS